MNADVLQKMQTFIKVNRPAVYSVLVVRHGYLVYEKYFRGDATQDYEVASVTKSVTSMLVGIAMQQGYIKNLDQKLQDFFPEYVKQDMDARTRAITLKNLLTMTSGFAWSEETPWSWPQSGDWVRYVIEGTMAAEPGLKFTYDTAAVHLLSGILTKVTGTSTLDFANRSLFQPLGIAKPQWEADPQGRNNGGRGLFLRARDMAKLGYLVLNDGLWDGQQIVPADWVRASTTKQNEGGFPEQTSYGYLWWVTTTNGHDAYYAAGYGGQFIYVIPDLDLVVVITSNPDHAHNENKTIVADFVIPAVSR
jgi:CubicO group peptidase (beta-lactamase class C family)